MVRRDDSIKYGSSSHPYSVGRQLPAFWCARARLPVFEGARDVNNNNNAADRIWNVSTLTSYVRAQWPDRRSKCDKSRRPRPRRREQALRTRFFLLAVVVRGALGKVEGVG
jgi:hypothetical protein